MKYDFKKISDSCVKCGKCIQVCTIYSINQDEVTSPRGFLDLVGAYQRGELKLNEDAKNIFESCFLCTNCVDICPSSLNVDTAIENIRSDIADKYGISWYKKTAFWLLGHRTMLDILSKMGYVFQTCGLVTEKSSKFDKSLHTKFDLPLLKKERLFPAIAKKSFMNSHGEYIHNGGIRTVGLFIGCMANYAYTDIGEGVLNICKALNINVDLMKKQACCGAPMYFTGDFKAVKKAAKFNIEYFEKKLEKLDAIIIPEATCSAMIRVDYLHLFEDDEEWLKRAKNINKKIFLATEYFYKYTRLKKILAKKGISEEHITYHDPCHARKMQGIYKEPRELLSQNYNIVEMSDPNKCCGFGGVTMQTNRYNLSKKAGQQKIEMLNNTGVKIVSAECSACKMQLNNALNLAKSDMRCMNPIELINFILENGNE
ncbi:anaerobic glycerol-3-phosphate dehydrogenase [Campylobacter blaseri]|uniref:Glycolate oxidase iron-sulfur subunit n=1 Tax=Campylobacter blaseri TaxID=2042961 RepID=A0A2P8R0K9_9BACT|nr:(Fe-S)-binding protein [Campylobacter blaseri]PSM52034.1 glycerol-3-phosphate dehydrogenase [Campylobacter blaseri]PSM53819.1 glycerol-3-phosphate dehydrogenase [Campylobacter blaseri]QKF85629.1 anaerobic glycerol-3-phosphate dehydrogenase [Campylobacter blaseri]